MRRSVATRASSDGASASGNNNKALVENLASRFLSNHIKRSVSTVSAIPMSRSYGTRAWMVDYSVHEDTSRVQAMEMRATPDVFERCRTAVVVAQLKKPTILNSGLGSIIVDAEVDGEDADLADYCDSCPLRNSEFRAEADQMCAFECAVRARSVGHSLAKTTYYAAVFRDKCGSFEEYLISSDVGNCGAKRATFSSKLRIALGQ